MNYCVFVLTEKLNYHNTGSEAQDRREKLDLWNPVVFSYTVYKQALCSTTGKYLKKSDSVKWVYICLHDSQEIPILKNQKLLQQVVKCNPESENM